MNARNNGDAVQVSPHRPDRFKSLSFFKSFLKALLCGSLLPVMPSTASAQDMVFLYHGLGVGPWHMGGIASKLEAGGYKVFNLDYNTMSALTTGGPQERTRVQSMIAGQNGTVSFVGHSMGGIYIRAILNGWQPQNMGRVVIIGSPNTGTTRAASLPEFSSFFSGTNSQTTKILQPGNQDTMKAMGNGSNLGYDLGTIAGDTMAGSDGLFTVSSVKVPGSKDHVTVPVGHASQPQNAQVQQLTYNFLTAGKFNPTEADIANARGARGTNQAQQSQTTNGDGGAFSFASANGQTVTNQTTGNGSSFSSLTSNGTDTTGGGLGSFMGGGAGGGSPFSSMMSGGAGGGSPLTGMLGGGTGGGTTGGGLGSFMGGGAGGGSPFTGMLGGGTGGGLGGLTGGGTTGGGLGSFMGGSAGGGSPFTSMLGGGTGGGLGGLTGGGATGGGLGSMMGGGSPFGGMLGGGQ